MASLTIENYVKSIYVICNENRGLAATGKVAEYLGVSPSTVTSMLKTLKDSGLAEYRPYEGVELTEAGRTLALRVLRRHRLIELFLVRTLNLSWDEVHDEAENMEHAVSDYLIDRIDEFLGHPASDPHGDPIPAADGTICTTDLRNLADWPLDTPFQLVRVLDQAPQFLRYLSDSGLALGATGTIAATVHEAGVLDITLDVPSSEQVTKTTLACEAATKLLVQQPESSDGK